MKILQKIWEKSKCEKILCTYILLIGICTVFNMARYILFSEPAPFLVQAYVCGFMFSVAVFVYTIKIPALALLPGVGYVILHSCSNMFGYTNNIIYMIMATISFVFAVVGSWYQFKEKVKPNKKCILSGICVILIGLLGAGIWCGNVYVVRNKQVPAQNEVWAVPEKYDGIECPNPGKVETFTYETKAYATDSRKVTKQAYVYLPYGYDETKEYDILYLMHGTGDDEAYWLEKYSYNKVMIDNLIYYDDIKPVIIVTPTWYVEDDLPDDPDQLTYSFIDELRNDLIPAVESTYATYAKSVSEEDLIASRNHRAFAGLSRGSATMFRSAYCGSLDYFSKFGAFSACMTTLDEFSVTWNDKNKDYTIDYLYNTSGTFDFLLDEHVKNTEALLEAEKRLVENVNYSFDIFPMDYHSIHSWHISLYNCLQKFYSY